jgi:hypothetical protein
VGLEIFHQVDQDALLLGNVFQLVLQLRFKHGQVFLGESFLFNESVKFFADNYLEPDELGIFDFGPS